MKDFLQKETGGLPNWVWLLVIIGGVGAVYIAPKLFGSKSTPVSTATADTGGGVSGLGGYIPGGPYAGGSTPTSSTSPGVGSELEGVIRQAASTGQTANYDQQNASRGVPIRATPGGATQGYQMFGTKVQIVGDAVQGPNDLGSTTWWPIAGGGYISSIDLSGNPSLQNWPYASSIQ